MSYKVAKASYRINGERIEYSGYEPKTGVLIISQAPKDDDKFIYIGQKKESNYFDTNSPNMAELGNQGTDLLLLHIVLEKLNTILKEKLYGMDAAGAEPLTQAIERQRGACLHDILTCGQYSKSEYELFSKKFVVTFNQRRNMALNSALKYIKSIKRELENSKLVVGIPRSFPAYIQISRDPTDLELHSVNDQLMTELKMYPELADNPLFYNPKKAYLPTLMLFGGKLGKKGKKNSIQPVNV